MLVTYFAARGLIYLCTSAGVLGTLAVRVAANPDARRGLVIVLTAAAAAVLQATRAAFAREENR